MRLNTEQAKSTPSIMSEDSSTIRILHRHLTDFAPRIEVSQTSSQSKSHPPLSVQGKAHLIPILDLA